MGRRAGQDPKPETSQQCRKKLGRERPAQRPANSDQQVKLARVIDPDSCPSGYDPDVWDMTLLFGQLAENHGIQLALGRPMVYSLLLRRMTELRDTLADKGRRSAPWSDKEFPMPTGVWSVDGITRVDTWQRIGRAAIRREWRVYLQDAYAADWFCGKVRFWQMVNEVRLRGYYRHVSIELAKQVAAQPETTLEEDLDAMARREARRLKLRHPAATPAVPGPGFTTDQWLTRREDYLERIRAFRTRVRTEDANRKKRSADGHR